MTKDEAKTLVAAGRIQAKILELCETDPSLLPLGLAERIRENNEEIRNLLQAAIDSYKKKAAIASKFLEEATTPLDVEAEDVQLQLDLQDVAAVTNTATWRQDIAAENAVQRAILEKAQEGAGRTACLEAAMTATGKQKAEVEIDWNGLVRNGLIEQKGKRWKATELGLEALAKPEEAKPDDGLEIVEETPEQMKDALDVRNAKLAEDLAAIDAEQASQASQPASEQPAEQVTVDPQWAIAASTDNLNF